MTVTTQQFHIGDKVRIVVGSQQGQTAQVIDKTWTGAERWVVIQLDATKRTCGIDPNKLAKLEDASAVFCLEKDGDMVEFRVTESSTGKSVDILKAWNRFGMRRTVRVFGVEQARNEYRKLLAAGYRPW
jgi:hypothetical protein